MSSKDKGFIGRHKVMSVLGGLIILIIIIVIANAGNKPNVITTSTSANSSSATSKSSTTSSSSKAHVGATENIGGSKGYAVTLQQVIDPAAGSDQYTTPDAGKRFVAVEMKIVNNGTAAVNDDANNDVTIIGSNNQTYTDDYNNVSECTDFNNGSFTLSAGESTTGCVNFQIPDGVTVSKVQLTPSSGFSGNTGEWLVP